MASTRTKTISYRRAVWLLDDGKDLNLETLLGQAYSTLKLVSVRKFKRPDGQFLKSIRHKPVRAGGHFVHIVAETPGDHASTLSNKHENQDGHDVGTAPPPQDSEFMDGDIFLYVKGNDVCICTTSLREGAVVFFLDKLFRKAKLQPDATKFDLRKVANIDKLKMINAQGVKMIDLNATLYEASTDYIQRNHEAAGALGVLGTHFNAIFGKDKKPKKDSLTVSVVLKSDYRMKEGRTLGTQRLDKLAKQIVTTDDDYVIVTREGQRISQDEIFVKASVEITRHGKSVICQSAWDALEEFHKGLVKSGVAAQ